MAALVMTAALVFGTVDGSPWEPQPVTPAAPAVRVVQGCTVDPLCTGPPPPTIPEWARCADWWPLALDVGWPEDQMATLDYVMFRESRCDPGATGSQVCNRRCARAQGLTQLLGWSCPPGGCYDPRSNLTKALELWRHSGWRPWCLRGDRVTGSC